MVAALLEASSSGGRTRLLNPHGLDALQLTEACAQSLAVIQGHALRSQGGTAASGMLVGVKQAVMIRPAAAAEAIEVSAQREFARDSLHLYRAIATTSDGTAIFSGEFTIALSASMSA